MKEFCKKFLGFSLGPIIGALINFITIPVTSHLVSADQFGLTSMYTLTQSIITLIVVMGIDQAFVREYNEVEDKKKLLANSVIIPFVASIIIGIIIIIFKNNLAQLLFNDSSITIPIILLALCIPWFIIENFILLSLRMQEKALQYSICNIASKGLNLILTIVLLLIYKRNFESIIYATILSQFIISILLLIIFRKNISISRKSIDKDLIKTIVKYGMPLIPATLISWGLNSMDSIFLRTMSNYTELGYYSVALKIASALTIIQSSFTTFWAPLAFRWKAEKVENEQFERIMNSVACVMGVALLGVLLFKNLIPYILGSGYDKTIYIIPFLMFYPVFYTMSETTTLGISFSKKTYYNIVVSVCAIVTNLVLNSLLIPKYQATGAAIATGISYLVFFWTRTLISRRLWYKFSIKKFIITTIILLLVSLTNCIIKNIYIISFINILSIVLILFNYKNIIRQLLTYLNKKDKKI